MIDGAQQPTLPAFGLKLLVLEEKRKPAHLADVGVSGYQELYHELVRQGWRWQKAAFMAWRAAPRRQRQPATQQELAELLGYNSDKVFRIWLQKRDQGPLMERIINESRQTVFKLNLADVDHVTIERATAVDSTVAERKLFYELLDRLNGVAGPMNQDNDTSDYSDDELQAEISRLEQMAA